LFILILYTFPFIFKRYFFLKLIFKKLEIEMVMLITGFYYVASVFIILYNIVANATIGWEI